VYNVESLKRSDPTVFWGPSSEKLSHFLIQSADVFA
jgi:hypothetical protein